MRGIKYGFAMFIHYPVDKLQLSPVLDPSKQDMGVVRYNSAGQPNWAVFSAARRVSYMDVPNHNSSG